MSDSTKIAPREKALPWDAIGFVAGLVLFALNLWRHRLFVHDDTFISLRYARNLAEHGELVWNLGERVEGYTNFLHVVASAGLIRLGLDPVIAAQLLNVGAAVLLLAAAAWAARLVAPEHAIARAAAVATLGATPAVAVWTLGGLEAVTVAALLALGMVGVLKVVRGGGNSPAAFSERFDLRLIRRRGQVSLVQLVARAFPSRRPCASGFGLRRGAPKAASARLQRRAARSVF